MYILIALVLSCAVGIGAHYALPSRELRGVAVTPAITTVTTGVIYTVLQWIGLAETNIWLWLASVVGGVVLGILAVGWLTGARARSDDARAKELGISAS